MQIEEDIEIIDDPDPSPENPSPKQAPQKLDSSDSSDDEVPKLKKKKSRTKRGLARKLAAEVKQQPDENDNEDEGSIYTDGIFNTGDIPGSWNRDIKSNSDDDEEDGDFHSLFNAKSSPPTQSRTLLKGAAQGSRKRGVPPGGGKTELASNLLDLSQKSDGEEVVCIGSDDEDDGGRSSPTPPPSPGENAMYRSKRKKKGVKKAMNMLDKASAQFRDEDPDGSIVDISSPAPLKSPHKNSVHVKVRSRSGIQRFQMGTSQPFSTILAELANHEMVKTEQIMLYVNDEQVQTYQTPGNLGIGVADIVECHIRKIQELESLTEDVLYPDEDPDVISLMIQGKDPGKSRITLKMRNHETMERVMRVYAGRMGLVYGRLGFSFDGEEIGAEDTAQDLELEDGYCIDVTGGI